MTGREALPFGFLNTTWRAGPTVVKEYEGGGAQERMAAEIAALEDVADLLPVPRIVAMTDEPPAIHLTFVEGENAAARLTAETMGTLGVLLRDFQAAYRRRTGQTRVHGDFGPHNVLLAADGTVAAVLDWEWSRLGEPITDAAWLEWVMRRHYPEADFAPFYDSYGEKPSWERRHLSMMDSVRQRMERAATDAQWWRDRLDATAKMVD
jgi:aminoglycoside phosphotransferase (APT) family kinase protein